MKYFIATLKASVRGLHEISIVFSVSTNSEIRGHFMVYHLLLLLNMYKKFYFVT